MPPARRTATCVCGGDAFEMRREPGTFMCNRCARQLPEAEVTDVTPATD